MFLPSRGELSLEGPTTMLGKQFECEVSKIDTTYLNTNVKTAQHQTGEKKEKTKHHSSFCAIAVAAQIAKNPEENC